MHAIFSRKCVLMIYNKVLLTRCFCFSNPVDLRSAVFNSELEVSRANIVDGACITGSKQKQSVDTTSIEWLWFFD